MAIQGTDWVIPLFFVAALVILARARKQIQAEDKESFKYISAGLVLLALVSIARLGFMAGYYADLPFLSDPLFYRIASWIVTITATAFVISGFASWLPVARRGKANLQTKLNRLEFLRKIESLTALESRPEHLFRASLEQVVSHFGFSTALVFRYSYPRNILVATGMNPEVAIDQRETIRLAVNTTTLRDCLDNGGSQFERVFEGLPDRFGVPSMVVPIMVQSQPVGFFVCWGNMTGSDLNESAACLRSAADIIGRKIAADRIRIENQTLVRASFLHDELAQIHARKYGSADLMAATMRTVRRVLSADTTFLWHVNPDKNYYSRYTIGQNGSLLHEKGVSVKRNLAQVIEHISESGPCLLGNSTDGIGTGLSALTTTAYKSAVALPVAGENGELMVLVAAGFAPDSLRPIDVTLVQKNRTILSQLVADATAAPKPSLRGHLTELSRAWREFAVTGKVDHLSDTTARLLAALPGIAMARISIADTSGQYLLSQSLANSFDGKPTIGRNGMLSLSSLPLHRRAVESGKTIWGNVTATEAGLTMTEASQVFSSRLSSITVLPFRFSGGHGVVTIGRIQNSAPLPATILAVARLASQGLGMAMSRTVPQLDPQEHQLIETGLWHDDLDMRSRVKSSLSGIFGSVELLKAKQEAEDPRLERYLGIIDKSARRISEYLDADHEEKILS